MRILILCLILCSSASAQLCDPNTNSLQFDGTTYVRFPSNNDLNISNKITVEAWIKVFSFAPNYVQGSIVCKHGWTQGEKGYVLRCGGNGVLAFAVAGLNNGGNSVGWKEVKSPNGSLQLNQWHHVAGTFDGHKLRLYIDAVQVGSEGFNGSINPSPPYDLKIGRIADDNTFDKRFFHGLIDDVRIWDDAISRNDIDAQMKDQISGSTQHLVAYWKFNDGTGTAVSNTGSTTCTGTLVGAHWDVDVPYTNGIQRPTISNVSGTLVSSALLGNQWNLNGVPIQGATGMTYTPTTGGTYTVTANYGLGCTATSDAMDFIIASVTENDRQFVLTNPGFDLFQIKSDIKYRSATLRIFDINGREVVLTYSPFEPIDLSDQNSGVYVFMLITENSTWTKKVVIE